MSRVDSSTNKLALRFLTRPTHFRGGEGANSEESLLDIWRSSDTHFFLPLAPAFLEEISEGYLNITAPQAELLLERFEQLLRTHSTARAEDMQMTVVRFLDSTLDRWLGKSADLAEIRNHALALSHWLGGLLNQGKIQSWRVRNALACYLSKLIEADPGESIWFSGGDEEVGEDICPTKLLPYLTKDEDIHVRFHAAPLCGRMLSVTSRLSSDAMPIYMFIWSMLPNELSQYVSNLTGG